MKNNKITITLNEVPILESCKFWEDARPNAPFNYKAEQIAKHHNLTQEDAEKYLKHYQTYFQFEI